MIAPLLDEIAREKADAVKVAKVNVDENQSLSLKYNIRAIPALLFFKNGQLRDQVTGVTSKKDLLNRSKRWPEEFLKNFQGRSTHLWRR
jgi:thioredoxin 1